VFIKTSKFFAEAINTLLWKDLHRFKARVKEIGMILAAFFIGDAIALRSS
jgi:hypothetical protein